MPEALTTLSFSTSLLLLVAGLGLFLLFHLLDRYLLPLIRPRRIQRKWARGLTVWQPLTWTAYALWVFFQALQANWLATLVLLALLTVAGLDYWRNLFAGLVIRLEGRLEPGQDIQVGEYTGKLIAIHPAQSELRLPEGGILSLPNTQLRKAVIRSVHSSKKPGIQLIPLTQKGAKAEAILALARKCPWIIPDDALEVEQKGPVEFELKARLVSQDVKSKVGDFFAQHLSGYPVPTESQEEETAGL